MSAAMQNLLIFLGLIGLAVFAYYLLVIQSGNELDTSASESASIESQLFLRQLNQIKSVSLDTSIFSDQMFRSLENQSTPVNPQPVGRTNPFAVAN